MAEGNKLLNLGEKVRENPKTIILSIPILAWAVIWLGIIGDREGQAGAYGHLGLTFKLMYKHGGRNPTFHRIAYQLFSKAESISTGNGRPTIILKKAQVLGEMGDWKNAENEIEKASKLAHEIKDEPQYAYLLAHLGRVKIINNDLEGSKKNLDNSLEILTKFSKDSTDMHIQVWMTTVELGLAEWYLANGDKKQATIWANKVVARSEEYNLKTRKVDGLNLLEKIQSFNG